MELNTILALAIGIIVGITIALSYVVMHSIRLSHEKAQADEEMSAILAEMFKEDKKPKRKKIEKKDVSVEAVKLSKD